ncbi:hypothetical protein Tco_0845820 [Tanacetum coccineum]
MNEANLTLEEYIELEAEKARRRGQTFNWETATYGKFRYHKDIDYFNEFETDFPASISNDAVTTDHKISSEPTVKDDNDEVNIPSNNVVVEQLDNIVDTIDTQSYEFDEDFETNHDIHREPSNMEDYLIMIEVMIQMHFHEGMLLICIIKNLYVPFGIPFDPKRFYKDSVCIKKLRRPRYEVKGYTNEIIHDFKERLGTIFGRQFNWVHVLDFKGLIKDMKQGLTDRLRMVYTRSEGQLGRARRSISWRQFILALGLNTVGEMAGDGFDGIASDGNSLEMVPSYTSIRDPLRRLCHRLIAVSISGRGNAKRNKRRARISSGHFMRHLAEHFGLVTKEGLWGLIVVVGELRVIDMDELVRLQISPTAAPATRTMPQSMAKLEEEVHGVRENLGEQRAVLDAMSRYFSRFTTWTVVCLSQLLDASGMSYMSYSDYQIPY